MSRQRVKEGGRMTERIQRRRGKKRDDVREHQAAGGNLSNVALLVRRGMRQR